MKLQELLKGIPVVQAAVDWEMEISGVSYDSRTTQPGDLFVAMTGFAADGHAFIQKAVEKGVSVAKEQINNPENHEKMIAAAVAAAKFVTDEKNRAKVKKVAEGVAKVAVKLVKK